MTRRSDSAVEKGIDNCGSTTNMIEKLGYDPRPEINAWRGTPIPPCDNPLPASDKLVAIAKRDVVERRSVDDTSQSKCLSSSLDGLGYALKITSTFGITLIEKTGLICCSNSDPVKFRLGHIDYACDSQV